MLLLVARSSDDFARYHAKLMIVDGHVLHVHGFNLTRADLNSRSFGIIKTPLHEPESLEGKKSFAPLNRYGHDPPFPGTS